MSEALFEEWPVVERERLRELRWRRSPGCSPIRARPGNRSRPSRAVRLPLAIDLLREVVHRALMRALRSAWSTGSALCLLGGEEGEFR